MRRTMVVGAVILAVLAVIGIGVAAFNAGVDEGISRELAHRDWTYVQQYADAKTGVIEAIIARARGAEPARAESLEPERPDPG